MWGSVWAKELQKDGSDGDGNRVDQNCELFPSQGSEGSLGFQVKITTLGILIFSEGVKSAGNLLGMSGIHWRGGGWQRPSHLECHIMDG